MDTQSRSESIVPTWLEAALVVTLAVSVGLFAIVVANALRVQLGVSPVDGALPVVACGLVGTGWMSGAMMTRLAPDHAARMPWWARYVFLPSLTAAVWILWLAGPGINTDMLSMSGLAIQMAVVFFGLWMLIEVFQERPEEHTGSPSDTRS